jgi:hypothetical protein
VTDTSPLAFTDARLTAVPRDPELDPQLAPVPERSLLDDLADDIADEVDIAPVSYPLPHRTSPPYAIVCDPNIPFETYRAWSQRHVDRHGNTDPLQLAAVMIAAKTVRIVRDGQAVTFDGQPVTFRSPELHQKLGVPSAVDAVKKMVGNDGDLAAIGQALILEAGYGRTVEGEQVLRDPTRG